MVTVTISGCDADQILDSATNTCITDTTLPIITANPTTITLEIDETFIPPTVSVTDNDPAYVGIITNSTAPSPVDTSNIEVFTITYSATADVAGNIPETITVTVEIVDTAAPIITASPSTIVLRIGETFTLPTVSVTDNDPDYVGTISNTTSPGPVDTSSIGNYTITYSATVDASNNAPIPITVTVTISGCDADQILDSATNTCITDTTLPIITANPTSITLEIGETFTPPTVSVTDNDPDYVGTISNTTSPGPVDTSSIGNYTITYSATADASNNAPTPIMVTVTISGCDADQILDSATNTCITDTTLPIITANPTSITLEIDETFTPPTVSVTDNDPAYVGTITNSTAPSQVDTSNLGVFTITYSATADVAGNIPETITVTVEIVDTAAPIITASPSTIVLRIGETFTPPTVSVTDNDPAYAGTISNTTSPGPVDTSNIGNYTITYSATVDASNNAPIPVEVTVNVTNCNSDQILDSATNTCITDTTLPIITANPTSITLEIDETFIPPTVSVTDNDPAYVGIITNSTTPVPVDTSNIGNYTITYSATADVAGNTPETITVTVEIVDTTLPIITANPTSITLEIGETFTPPTVSVTDNDPAYSGIVTNSTSPGPVDTSNTGVFTITYSATADASNNVPIHITVTVTISGCDADQILDSATNTCVTDTVLPVITVSPTTITLEIDETFTPPTVSVTDNDPAYVGTITDSTSPGPVDTSSIGVFTITYSATADAAGNMPATVTATVEIVDTIPPIITVSHSSISLKIGETFTAPTVSVTDNDPSYVGIITNSTAPSPVDTSSIGVFITSYSAPADASGNAPTPVTVTVSVTNCDSNEILDSNLNSCVIDTEKPIITASPTTITLKTGDTYTPPTVSVTDNDPAYLESVTFTVTPGPVVTSSVGVFTISYMAPADAAGNIPAPVTATITITGCDSNEIIDPNTLNCVVDSTEPTIIIPGPSSITILQNSTYSIAPPSISDNNPNHDGSFNTTHPVDPLDTSVVGNTTITYTTTDPAGNIGTTTISIHVIAQCPAGQVPDSDNTFCIIDDILPVILVNRSSENRTLSILVGASFVAPPAVITDNDPAYNGTVITTVTPGVIDTSAPTTFTISYTSVDADAAGNMAIPVVITLNIVTECPANQIPNSDNLCIYSRGGSDSGEWKTKPTFGVSWENNQPFVSGGFTLNGYTLDITDNWHASFVSINGVIGNENNAQIKVYAPKGLATVLLSLGVPEVGKVNDAESNIMISLRPNYTDSIFYSITGITLEQKESLVDENKTTAAISKSLCNNSNDIEKCYTIDINFVVLAPLKYDSIAITAIDTKNRYTTTYINEGLTFAGDSMLEPATAQLVVKRGNQYEAETIDLIQQDRRHNLWEDQYGNLWTQNDHDTWLQLTFPENTPKDSYVNVMTRIHTAFDSRVDVHTQNMESIRDDMYKGVYTESDSDDP